MSRWCSVTGRPSANISQEPEIHPMHMLPTIVFQCIPRWFSFFLGNWVIKKAWFLFLQGLCGNPDAQQLPSVEFRLTEGGIVLSEERNAPGVTADILKVVYCPSISVLKWPFQVLNTAQTKNFPRTDSMGVSDKGLDGFGFHSNLEFVGWSMAGSYHDIADLVCWIQMQKYCLYPNI